MLLLPRLLAGELEKRKEGQGAIKPCGLSRSWLIQGVDRKISFSFSQFGLVLLVQVSSFLYPKLLIQVLLNAYYVE